MAKQIFLSAIVFLLLAILSRRRRKPWGVYVGHNRFGDHVFMTVQHASQFPLRVLTRVYHGMCDDEGEFRNGVWSAESTGVRPDDDHQDQLTCMLYAATGRDQSQNREPLSEEDRTI